jgi:sugar/nucleoside kinase (ribokinase family)
MSRILVSGLINVETTLQVEAFPIPYSPVRYPFFGVNSTVSGVGFNIAKALTTLGDDVRFLSMIGHDPAAALVHENLRSAGISAQYIMQALAHTPQSVILYDHNGDRQINVDLKDIQDRTYPEDLFDEALRQCSLACLCNINFSRPFLVKARRAGKLIATDVHAIASLDDEYNRDFMKAADILFLSDESLPTSPKEWVRTLVNRFGTEIVVVGLGANGTLLSVKRDRFLERIPAVKTRPVKNTIGAGDALFSAFVHFYNKSRDPYDAIERASVFASHKIGEAGAADGFLDEAALNRLHAEVCRNRTAASRSQADMN